MRICLARLAADDVISNRGFTCCHGRLPEDLVGPTEKTALFFGRPSLGRADEHSATITCMNAGMTRLKP